MSIVRTCDLCDRRLVLEPISDLAQPMERPWGRLEASFESERADRRIRPFDMCGDCLNLFDQPTLTGLYDALRPLVSQALEEPAATMADPGYRRR